MSNRTLAVLLIVVALVLCSAIGLVLAWNCQTDGDQRAEARPAVQFDRTHFDVGDFDPETEGDWANPGHLAVLEKALKDGAVNMTVARIERQGNEWLVTTKYSSAPFAESYKTDDGYVGWQEGWYVCFSFSLSNGSEVLYGFFMPIEANSSFTDVFEPLAHNAVVIGRYEAFEQLSS